MNGPVEGPHLAGRTVVITGASSGIGAAAAQLFADAGASVVVVGRSPQRTERVAQSVGGVGVVADFEDLASVRSLAAQLLRLCPRIDVLANNAGGIWPRSARTIDGFERTMQVNHLAPFLLTWLLRPRLVESSARVIDTSSAAHRAGRFPSGDLRPVLQGSGHYVPLLAYGRSKLANILHARELQHRYGPLGLTAMSFHPGLVATRYGRDGGVTGALVSLPMLRARMTSPEQAALRLLWLAGSLTAGSGAPIPGEYHDGSADGRGSSAGSRQARDPCLARRVWDASAAVLGLGD